MTLEYAQWLAAGNEQIDGEDFRLRKTVDPLEYTLIYNGNTYILTEKEYIDLKQKTESVPIPREKMKYGGINSHPIKYNQLFNKPAQKKQQNQQQTDTDNTIIIIAVAVILIIIIAE